MKESYREQLAIDFGPEPYAGSGNVAGVAWGMGDAGQPLSSDIKSPVCRSCTDKEKATPPTPQGQGMGGHGGVVEPEHVSTFQAREPGDPHESIEEEIYLHGIPENVTDGKAGRHLMRESDEAVVPTKFANKSATDAPAEQMEERNSAKRNANQHDQQRTPSRHTEGKSGLERVRETARKDRKIKFTALLHHVNEQLLVESFHKLRKHAAVGVDGVTWHEYDNGLTERIRDLHRRIHLGSYRATPSKRKWILKPDGRKRPLGIASLEDKIVQHAITEVLRQIYEEDFLGFSYGFRAGGRPHDALDALAVGITSKKVNWIIDADIEGFFDAINHDWMIRFLEHRIGDRRIIRLIRKWLSAGISEEGNWQPSNQGTPQGAIISPLLANVYLHYALDQWFQKWRKTRCQGNAIIVRYADDFVIGLEHQQEAQTCLEELKARLAKFGLKLHEGKTRLIEFGRHAAANRAKRGDRRPETFDFLGFTHKCAKKRSDGSYVIHRHTIAKRMRATLQAVKEKLRKRMHQSTAEVGKWLAQVIRGWLNYHAVPYNSRQLGRFVDEISRHWHQTLQRRSQRGQNKWTWERMQRLVRKHLPRPKILHPYPEQRHHARLKARAV